MPIYKYAFHASMAVSVSIALAGCDKLQIGSTSDTKAEVSIIERTKGLEFYSLPACNRDVIPYIDSHDDKPGSGNIVLDKISHVFIVELNEVDPRNIIGSVTKKKPNKTFDGEDLSDLGNPARSSDKPKPSKLDFYAELGAPEEGSDSKVHYKTALVKVILKPSIGHHFKLVDAKYVLRAGDPNGVRMFCDASRLDDSTATFKIYRFPEKDKAYGSFNIGLTVEDEKGQHETTIFIDPEVKNEG